MRTFIWATLVAGLFVLGIMMAPSVTAANGSFSVGLNSGLSTGVHHFKLTSPNAETWGFFGYSVAISGTTGVVGAPAENASGDYEAGHAYTYTFNTTMGKRISTLTSPNPQIDGYFGWSVAVSGTTVVIGAYGETASGLSGAGHAYIFNAMTGKLLSTLTSPNAQTGRNFGYSVAVSGTTVVVGAPYENASGRSEAGHAYTFNASTGKRISTLTSPNAQSDGFFGYSVAVSGTTVVVGAPYETASGQSEAGHAYTFNATTGKQISTLTGPNGGNFGWSVAIGGKTVVVGAAAATASGQPFAGQAYTVNSTTGKRISTLSSPNAQNTGYFGDSVAVSGLTVVVGATYETASGQSEAGHAYTFNATTGKRISTLTSPNAQTSGYFGWSVAISGATVVIGAYGENASGDSVAGHAYVS
jgi:FG-GAP repeat